MLRVHSSVQYASNGLHASSCNDIHDKLVVIKPTVNHTNPQENNDNSGYK